MYIDLVARGNSAAFGFSPDCCVIALEAVLAEGIAVTEGGDVLILLMSLGQMLT